MSEKDEAKPEKPESGESSKVAKTCPTCREEIPEDAPGGICPKCALLEAAAFPEENTLPMTGPRFEPPSLETIATAFPHLEIIELIGCGGMGAVYQARQSNLDRLVALKILPPSLAGSAAFRERFVREGRLLAKLSHPNIVGVHDFGESGGFFFLLMEFVDGVNLRQAMRAGRFTPEQAVGIVPEICEALQFAHEEGVLHRDIKPENILLDAKGRVKIADFGIAKLIGESAASEFSLTGTSMPGTPQYMAPEQIEHPEDVDHRADIFSLGVVFYEMLTGELPMGRFSAPSEKTAVDSQVDEIVFRSLEKERDRRQQSAGQVKTEIQGISVETLAKMRHPGYEIPAGSKTSPFSSGGARAAWFVGTGLALLVIFLVITLVERQQSLVQLARSRAEENRARVEAIQREHEFNQQVVSLQKQIRENPGAPEADELRKKLTVLNEELKRNPIQRTVSAPVVHVSPVAPFILLALLLMAACIPGTIMGWRSLRKIRALGLDSGKGGALFAALFWPLTLITLLSLGFMALMSALGPSWITAIIMLIYFPAWLAFLGFSIWWVRKWVNSPPSKEEKAKALAKMTLPKNPWINRILWLLGLLVFVPLFVIVVARLNFVPGIFELLIVGGIVAGFVILIVALFRRGKGQTAGHSAGDPVPAHNPWPRRTFWLIIVIFVLPALIVPLSLVVPYFTLNKQSATSHHVEIQDLERVENVVRFNIYSELTGSRDVVFRFRYDGPQFLADEITDNSAMFPEDGREWRLNETKTTHYERIALAFPDQRRADMAEQWIQAKVLASGPRTWNLREINFFEISAAEGGVWRAVLDIESENLPPLEETE